MMLVNGISQFCEDLKLDPASFDVLLICWKFKAEGGHTRFAAQKTAIYRTGTPRALQIQRTLSIYIPICQESRPERIRFGNGDSILEYRDEGKIQVLRSVGSIFDRKP